MFSKELLHIFQPNISKKYLTLCRISDFQFDFPAYLLSAPPDLMFTTYIIVGYYMRQSPTAEGTLYVDSWFTDADGVSSNTESFSLYQILQKFD